MPKKSIIIGTVGRLSPEKGHYILLDVAREIIQEYPAIFIVVAGEGQLKDALITRAKKYRLEKQVLLPGKIRNVPEILSIFDIFVMPSLAEGLPMALLEAMAARKPIIASKVGSIPKLITPDETGLLVEPGDISSLHKSIVELLKNKKKANTLAENGYTKIINYFSSERWRRDI